MINYLPTGTCFDDTFDIIQCGYIPRDRRKDVRIVHALVKRINPVESEPQDAYAHAWVELGGEVLEVFIDSTDHQKIVMHFTPEQHASVLEVLDRTEYSLQEIAIAGLQDPMQSSGPYKLKYLQACRDWEQVKHHYDFEGVGV